jgi:hypothetical protein
MAGQQTTARMGRPSEITKVVRHRSDGSPVTAGEQIIERAQLGLDYQAAADSAGISRLALHHWRLDGARLRAVEAQGKRELAPHEAVFRDFVNALERAESEWEAARLAIIQRGAQGGATVTKTTEKWVPGPNPGDPQVLVERTVVTETLRPEWTAAAWQLERRKPHKYGRRVALTDGEGGPLIPVQEQARGLADSLREYMLGVEDGKKAATKAKAIPAKSTVKR